MSIYYIHINIHISVKFHSLNGSHGLFLTFLLASDLFFFSVLHRLHILYSSVKYCYSPIFYIETSHFFPVSTPIAQGWYHQWLVWLSLIWWTPKANTFPNTNHCQVHISEWDISRTSHILCAENEIMLSVQAVSSSMVNCLLIKVNLISVACKVLHGQDLPYFLTSSQIPYLSSS